MSRTYQLFVHQVTIVLGYFSECPLVRVLHVDANLTYVTVNMAPLSEHPTVWAALERDHLVSPNVSICFA